ncbi:uncharacterized protein RHIMIDRAFT_235047 [Rhizopus microsporus ATCC 52813]|uniref:Uncharacterized protein n=2 Tax=Rhizopus microsporus TaxID=58291 RepID=A0A2G4T3Y5_RHIZD|nr:uncharacterized protein RHIMIDRAFT_235047 [Rhizopus microsporus ATCC 52813]PHZ15708.1 hypothetical protein RHIMIDRAFT_235047 [Rhizopus microsporus ATCC 52813]
MQQQQQQQSGSTSNDMDDKEVYLDQLYSFETRRQYDWVPSAEIQPFLNWTNRESTYPPIQGLNYRPPSTVSDAYNHMSQGQKREDKMLKHHQYVLSAAFRPLDLLAHEISLETNNPNIQR